MTLGTAAMASDRYRCHVKLGGSTSSTTQLPAKGHGLNGPSVVFCIAMSKSVPGGPVPRLSMVLEPVLGFLCGQPRPVPSRELPERLNNTITGATTGVPWRSLHLLPGDVVRDMLLSRPWRRPLRTNDRARGRRVAYCHRTRPIHRARERLVELCGAGIANSPLILGSSLGVYVGKENPIPFEDARHLLRKLFEARDVIHDIGEDEVHTA
eukprot:1625374-Prymnesium_polylepis.1